MAFDALEEVERIDGLLREYESALAAVRPRMEADDLNRDYRNVVEALRYDPDAIRPSQWNREDVMKAAEEIMKGFKWRETPPPVS